jgi:5-formyltetrahydrofolate cyclo-ligase
LDKRTLRREIFKVRDALTRAEIETKSRAIAARLYDLPAYRESRTILFFLSFRSEVDTAPMVVASIARGKQVAVPKAVPETRQLIPSLLLDPQRDLAPGFYGIPEPHPKSLRPLDPGALDLIIVPGVAFDESGNRLGYGGGYYDRFFPLLKPRVPLVALAFELQILSAVPVDQWDRRVDYIVTEKRLIAPDAGNSTAP